MIKLKEVSVEEVDAGIYFIRLKNEFRHLLEINHVVNINGHVIAEIKGDRHFFEFEVAKYQVSSEHIENHQHLQRSWEECPDIIEYYAKIIPNTELEVFNVKEFNEDDMMNELKEISTNAKIPTEEGIYLTTHYIPYHDTKIHSAGGGSWTVMTSIKPCYKVFKIHGTAPFLKCEVMSTFEGMYWRDAPMHSSVLQWELMEF